MTAILEETMISIEGPKVNQEGEIQHAYQGWWPFRGWCWRERACWRSVRSWMVQVGRMGTGNLKEDKELPVAKRPRWRSAR